MPLAARLTDQTTHGTPLAPGIGSINVMIASLPAWRTMLDQHICPAVSISGADGVGSVLMGSPTVWTNSQMACRQFDIVVEKPGLAMGPVNPIMMGCPTVEIGGPTAAVSIPRVGMLTITSGGMTITGAEGDVAILLGIIGRECNRSLTMAQLFQTITSDTANPTNFTLVRNDPHVYVDAFNGSGNHTIDMKYFDGPEFPDSPSANHPDACTAGENLVHGMDEAHQGAVLQNTNGADPSGNNWYNQSHQHAINSENNYRNDRGQGSNLTSSNVGPGPNDITFQYDNGASEVHDTHTGNVTHTDPSGNVIP